MSRTKQAARKGQGGAGPRAIIAAQKAKKVRVAMQNVESESNEDPNIAPAANPPVPHKQLDLRQDSDGDDSSDVDKRPQVEMIKTKRDRDEFESDAVNEDTVSPAAKKKKYKSKAERKAAKATGEEDGGAGDNCDPAIAQMDTALLADHFAKTIKRFYKNNTALELERRYLPGSTFTDTTSLTVNRKKCMLGTYLEAVVAGDRSKLETSTKAKASPHTLVLCSSGIRGADLGRVLRMYETDSNKVAKLFAKHFKIEQQACFLRKTSVGFGVCTPDRIRKLIETQALKVERLARIVIDGSYLDEKNRGLWNMAEVFRPMLELLRMDEIQERIEDGSLKVVVF